nr:zinc finger, CCHC-type, retrotransposon Gag domain protein [Tanacetum cinerariifolium]
VLSNPGVPLRVTLILYVLLVDVDTKESVVELQLLTPRRSRRRTFNGVFAGRGVVIGISRPLNRVVTGATVIITTVMYQTGVVVVTTTAVATTTTLAVTTGIPVMGVTRETWVISPIDLPILSRGPSEGYSYLVCTTCGRRHPGECRRAAGTCFKCGQAGHLQKDCKKNTTTSTSGQADKKPGASGRIFAITEGHAANSSGTITGTLFIYGHAVFVLFDTGATHSVISSTFYDTHERLKREYHSIRQTSTETSTEFMQRFLQLAGFFGAAAGTEEEQAKNFQWGLRRCTLNHLMCMSYTDVAQVANAARNYEILHERDGDDTERPDKRQRSG